MSAISQLVLPYCYKDGKKELYAYMVAGNESSCYSGSGESGRGAMKSSLYYFIFFLHIPCRRGSQLYKKCEWLGMETSTLWKLTPPPTFSLTITGV